MIVNNNQNKRTRNILSGLKNKGSNTISFLNLPFNKLTILHNSNKTQIENYKKSSFKKIIDKNLKKHNITQLKKGIIDINDLIDSKNCHLVAIFKDYLISDYIDEFLRRFYNNKEIKDRIPKFEGYYKNYLTFFCKPTFSDFFANNIIQAYGEAKAEIYYNQNYGKKKKKEKINKEIAKTILNTLIRESIDGIENISMEKMESIIIDKENTILLPDDETILINGNKNSNESSINSILRCFSYDINKNHFKTICSSSKRRIKKIKNISLNQNNKKGINTLTIQSNKNKSSINKFIPNNTIQTSSRLYSNQMKEEKNNIKNSKVTLFENSTSQNNLSNRTKNKSKDFSNSKGHQMTSTLSNSNFSRNHLKIPLSNKNIGMYLDNQIYFTSNSPISSQRIKMKKASNGKRRNSENNNNTNTNNNNTNNINNNNNNNNVNNKSNNNNKSNLISNKSKKKHLKKNSENIDLKDIMKLTFQVYDYKTRNIKNMSTTINNNNSKHFHTLSSPTINNFNININNHICLNNNNSLKSKKSSFQKKNINSRNKEQNLFKINTEFDNNRNKNYSPNFQNYATSTINDLDSIMKNKFFFSLNGSDKISKKNNGFKSNRLFNNSNLKIKNIYNKEKALSPQIIISPKGFFSNKNLKNHINSKKIDNRISPQKTQK